LTHRATQTVETVLGPVEANELGLTLIHEHVMVDWIGADETGTHRYDPDAVVALTLPYLRQAAEHGVRTFVDCTPAYLGRDVRVLSRLSEASGLHILTNTGFYGAADDRFLPRTAYERTAGELADIWIRERAEGIEGTGVRPAFIKIGVDAGPLSPVDEKLVEAAALAHQATGMHVHAHTSDTTAGLAELDVLERIGVPPEALVWVHAQNVDDVEILAGVATRGAWVELDGVAPDTAIRHAELTVGLAERGLLGRVLLSHDAGTYTVGEPDGGAASFRAYYSIFTMLIPELRRMGISDEAIRMLLVDNPRSVLGERQGVQR
jgi:predicted metal-dependent phosphotriesterase family hydrolase